MCDLSRFIQKLCSAAGEKLTMPYSKSLGLIFVAIPKTGTTSMTRALQILQVPHGGDIQLAEEHITEEFRSRYCLDELGDSKPGRAKHLSAIQLKYVLGHDEFNRCTKFSLVRNPWARMVSKYHFTHQEFEPSDAEKLQRETKRSFHCLDFETWVYRGWKRHRKAKKKRSQLDKLVDLDGRMLVNHIGRLENAQDTLDWITRKLGVDRIEMPHVNGTRTGHYAKLYNRRTREMVWEMCRRDIEFFDYRFDETGTTADINGEFGAFSADVR